MIDYISHDDLRYSVRLLITLRRIFTCFDFRHENYYWFTLPVYSYVQRNIGMGGNWVIRI